MPKLMEKEEFQTAEGRKRAWRSLMLGDHGFIRKVYDNSHAISDEMWRTYQPSPANIVAWKERGIKTIINLRGLRNGTTAQAGFYWLEEEAAEKNGIKLINFRAYSREAPKREFLLNIDKLFREIEYPAIMHCKSGADRAGIASTLYKFLKLECSLDEAQEQLSYKFGHVKSGKTGVLDHFFDVYREKATQDGVTPNREHFLEWVENEYDPKTVNDGFKPGTIGTILTEVILRRE